ncbi:hypothetical protein INR49_020774 [Caranx melampygus]|nr:hypothetical protein INR49_020774 [Caranx melampygus]
MSHVFLAASLVVITRYSSVNTVFPVISVDCLRTCSCTTAMAIAGAVVFTFTALVCGAAVLFWKKCGRTENQKSMIREESAESASSDASGHPLLPRDQTSTTQRHNTSPELRSQDSPTAALLSIGLPPPPPSPQSTQSDRQRPPLQRQNSITASVPPAAAAAAAAVSSSSAAPSKKHPGRVNRSLSFTHSDPNHPWTLRRSSSVSNNGYAPLTHVSEDTSACLHVSPDRSQFFKYDTISMSCVDPLNSTGWRVKRRTLDGGVKTCSSGWGSMSSAWTCIIGNTYPSDSGVYWCESVDGQQSNAVNITITDLTVILESPALPVLEGAAVTLHCKAQSSDHRFDFYKDGRLISNSSTGQLTFPCVSKSDEGLYTCSISGGEQSRASWLAVEASSPDTPAASCSASVLRIVLHVLVGTPYLLSTIILGLIYRDRKKAAAAQTVAKKRGSNDVVMEIVV